MFPYKHCIKKIPTPLETGIYTYRADGGTPFDKACLLSRPAQGKLLAPIIIILHKKTPIPSEIEVYT
ncbi:hypothetical protein D1818_08350 [Aquimarina sp. BL5]|uniref:hypothetical protein n=1 Tax=Aquimarina sp. BL5 TaxID=1714860 RepID=UPI000E54941A|nr:hypothetical protein [Aquimarina sp. BL5]AXT50837.1 hypothetical protein D1818_08350 [Aquimarina sp. BL5]RKN00143.1 hypothetical protein D7036_19255 [Aquimarina sp. BL5]